MRNRSRRWLLASALSVVMIMGSGVPAFAAPSSTQQAADDPGGFWDPIRHLFGASSAPRPKEPPKSVDLRLDGVPHDDPGSKGKAWAPAKRVKELTSRRTRNARFYLLSDGRMQAEVSQTPLNYRDGGTWKPIDLSVRAGSGGWAYQNVANAFTSRFGDRSDKLVRFESGGRHIELGLTGPATDLTPKVDGSTVTYPGAAGGADVVYEVTPTTLQEDFVLAKAPAEPLAVTLSIKTGGLLARQAADGSIEFTGPDGGRVLFVMPAPYMFDSKDDAKSDVGKTMSRNVAQILTQNGSTAEITIVPDAAWLADAARQYPVTIDPTIKIQPVPSDGQDVEIYSGTTGTNYNSTYQLKVGTESTSTWRSLVRFPLTGIPAGTPIDDAQLQLYYSQTHWDYSYDVALEARRVTSAWDESTATWGSINTAMAAQPAGNVVVVDDGDAGASFSGTWPYSTNSLTAKAIGADYRYNNDATAGNTHTWTPTITEAGNYQVEVHFTSEADRSTVTPYTVYYNGGSKAYTVDQTGAADGVWKTLGVHPFAAGTTGKVVLGDVANKSVIADAVRFTKWGTTTKKAGVSSVWNSFPVRNVVQDWVNGVQPNYGFMIKAVDEQDKGRGGPVYEASEYAYDNNRRDYNLPKLVVTFGRPGVSVDAPTTIASTGAALTWPAYVDPTGSASTADDIVEYQVHRSVYQTFVPSAATLVAPVAKNALAYQDTTAVPTPTDETDPLKRHFYYYMIAVKTADGQVIAGPTQGALLPKAGRITKVFRETTANQVPDTTLSAAQPTANVNVYGGDPYVSPGNNSSAYGDTRGLVKFANLTGVPANANVVDAQLEMWNTGLYPGNVTDGKVDVHRLTRAFDETTATWNSATSGTAWTTPGGDYDPTAESYFDGFTNDPEWESWTVTNTVKNWLTSPTSNYGFLLKMRDEVASTQRAMLLSSEGAEPMLRPTLRVTYLEPTPESTYYAPGTAGLMAPDSTYPVTVSVSNPTGTAWTTANWELSYHWSLPDGTDVTTSGNQVATALPRDIAAGATADVAATVKTPVSSDPANKRTDYVLRWELHNKTTGQWLSAGSGIASLDQKVAVEEATSDELGLESFYSYDGVDTGAGSALMNNLHAGNTVWTYDALSNPSRGIATVLRLAYNSQDTTDTVTGYGWSLQASSPLRLGSALDFHPNPNPTTVKLTDGDGTTHTFSWNATANEWTSPKGVHLFLQQLVSCKAQTEADRAWTMTRPDRTVFYYDCDGYLSSIEDKNGNLMTFTYEVRRSQNKPTKFLKYITDAAGRQTLTLTYWAKGDTYDYVNDTTWAKVTGQGNLTNPKIIDHVRSIVDISGRTLTFTYTDKGLLGELVDGAGWTQPKVFGFQYDMTQGNKNVKLVKVVDPRGHGTALRYYDLPDDDPKFHWATKDYTDRLGNPIAFAYSDPDGPTGDTITTVVVDAENHPATFRTDGYGRTFQTTNAKNQTTKLGWDGDHNVIRLEEADGAVSTSAYDPKTGYPTESKTAEQVKNGWPGTTYAYQTGLTGHWADLIAKQSSEGRRWTFGYDLEGNLTSATDPAGTSTPADGDYTTTYAYDTYGQLTKITDANGHSTPFGSYDPTGLPRTSTDALTRTSTKAYDERGNVVSVTDAKGKTSTFGFDLMNRPLTARVPKNAATGDFLVKPAPVYDANDNILESTAANGAKTTATYDYGDRTTATFAPKDTTGGPERKTSYGYDKVGNVLTVTEPNGNLTADANDFVTRYAYDEIYQNTSITDARNGVISYTFDSVGNITKVVDQLKNATADPDDFTTKVTYDSDRQVRTSTDAAGFTSSVGYDRDGLMVTTTDEENNQTFLTYDARGLLAEAKEPYDTVGGVVAYHLTRYEYDQVGNRTKVISPRGVATTDDPDDFAQVAVYDELNRIKEQVLPYDKDDAYYTVGEKVQYTYDEVGNLTKVSQPTSGKVPGAAGPRVDTGYTYLDNGWIASTTDPFGISTTFDYNPLGQQTRRTVTGADGGLTHTMTMSYYPDGKLQNRADEGVPVGSDVSLWDNTDEHYVTTVGDWTTSTQGTGFVGTDYATHAPGTGANKFTWVPPNRHANDDYEVFVRYPAVAGAATDAKYTLFGQTKVVDQTQHAGEWVSLGTYPMVILTNTDMVTLSDNANGIVVADAIKFVRDTTGVIDNERQSYTYTYDANGNLTTLSDGSTGSQIDRYTMTYTGLNQLAGMSELDSGAVQHTSTYDYDANGNVTKRTFDSLIDEFVYDARDLVTTAKNLAQAGDPNPRISAYTYTPRGQLAHQTKPLGGNVDFTYYADGRLRHLAENTGTPGRLIAEHTLKYDLNGNPAEDVARLMNADNTSAYLDRTLTYQYDPRDRITQVAKGTDRAEKYVYDANSNILTEEFTEPGGKKSTTANFYDRNRLTKTIGGSPNDDGTTTTTSSFYYYDPFGRTEQIRSTSIVTGGDPVDPSNSFSGYVYDGFDRKIRNEVSYFRYQSITDYAYDTLNRTISTSRKIYGASDTGAQLEGQADTAIRYMGASDLVLSEQRTAGVGTSTTSTTAYRYGAGSERISQTVTANDGGPTGEFNYVHNARGDVEAITDASGNTRATYGYTAYGQDDAPMFTGVDKPDSADLLRVKRPVNIYRFNAQRWDQASGTYDMGFRDYSPTASRFLTPDFYTGALADFQLGMGAGTANRYLFASGNPIGNFEVDGHFSIPNWLKQIGGFFKGIGEQAWATVTGLWDFGAAVVGCFPCGEQISELWNYAGDNPGEFWGGVWHSIWDPIADDWNRGNYGEAIGRAVFSVAELVFGGKGIAKIKNVIRARQAAKAAEAAVLAKRAARIAQLRINRIVGAEAEKALGIPARGKKAVRSFSGEAARRFPDYNAKRRTVVEVKAEDTVDFTGQTLDLILYGESVGKVPVYIVRQDAIITTSMRAAQELRLIRIYKWLPPLHM
ncbi:MAG: DNRLRE domain-containing protein [Hamadaea sp.]|nr:DNRLRE domain-containing protein [Hamadaea sp.]